LTRILGTAAPLAWSEPGRTTLEIRTGGWRSRRPLYVEAEAPCRLACPAGESIARWIELVRQGNYAAAWALIREDNPLPAVTGRVCAHPCEAACNRAAYDGAVAVNALERFVGDWGLEHGMVVPPRVRRAGRVAVVGGGPAGLACAAHLAGAGHGVTIFEAEPQLGGLLRYGIPEYRLPRGVLDREIELLIALGIEVVTGARLGTTLAWNDLDDYGAVFLGCGAGHAVTLDVPGASARGVGDGLGFLRAVNGGERPDLGARVVVGGGGSTAMDVARVARRLGASIVTVLALEPRTAMPADVDEIRQALDEGVTIVNGVGVCRFVESAGALSAVEVGPAVLGRVSDGSIVARFTTGDSRLVAADAALLALGQRVDVAPLSERVPLARGLVSVDGPRLFAGGDVTSRRRTVADAIGAGTRAARAIASALAGGPARAFAAQSWAVPRPDLVVGDADVNLAHLPRARRAHRWERLPDERVRSFVEVQAGLSERAALGESARCYTCGRCTSCDVCVEACPDIALVRTGRGYRVATDHCKGCGLCAAECPRGALRMVAGQAAVRWSVK
jgi:NADPH-dependent glutamate synthase beta subunit-like oxidoreductase